MRLPRSKQAAMGRATLGPTVVRRILIGLALAFPIALPQPARGEAIHETERKMVKVYGAGGIRGLEAYQSGFLISGEGHVLTAWSYILDTDAVIVTLFDGSRHEATLVGADPRMAIAVLKIDAKTRHHFSLTDAIELEAGDRVLAFSNLYGIATGAEASSVLHGSVSAVTQLAARRGAFKTPYQGPIYLVDAVTNNAGAAGGALTDYRGRLAGVLGKELRSAETDAWINYAIPIQEILPTVDAIREGRSLATPSDAVPNAENPWTLDRIGLQLVPNVLSVTPPYVEGVRNESPAALAKLRSDDLVIYVDGNLVRSRRELEAKLLQIEATVPLSLAVLRDQELVTVRLEASEP